ncbi:MAG TPA: FHA domain-containing protein [Woeseiaceae bacterium]|jgi:chromosome segregation ATPase|nr:FHA domain-containing protein [Woeseiaceae bacterium]
MANDKSNINELVTDDDTTAELEALTVRHLRERGDALLEAAALTDDIDAADDSYDTTIDELRTELHSSSETINKLQYDIEQFRSRWNGLEAEIKARQDISDNLNRQLEQEAEKLQRKNERLQERDETIQELKAEIRERDAEQDRLRLTVSELEAAIAGLRSDLDADRGDEMLRDRQFIERQQGRIASLETETRDLRAHIDRSERYADSLRRELEERRETADEAVANREFLETKLDEAITRIVELESKFIDSEADRLKLESDMAALHSQHAEEIRTIRFELGEAQETAAQQELVAEQLASDLVETRGYRSELEQMLFQTESIGRERIEELEKRNAKLTAQLKESDSKLASKNEAINSLLAKLAKKTQQIESIVEIEDVIQEIDGRMSARIEGQTAPERDRVTRLLIGTLEGQKLRFPLFKDRLTIGRTDQNDIQLNAAYVSRRHAVVVTDHATTRVIDWGSKNGVFVNGDRITEHFLENGDIVTIGTAEFRYEERPKRDN